ncbi:sodium/proline symporter, SSF family [Thermococcus kodakarensis KOD1]|uniref:Sodium/proline symporter, SSF family n=1 Tax=Thermococcus kodakarensis (strain ATCC BAA-918 / JCM 12380 / KOD1) TaxID=69014 RepID=Q5JIL6_THEKO|nr:sodium/proline symporter [Thermococcus kodakarensis]WCN27511.1 sodium/proline symporter [Thermococcus kodakarensis]WCN29802.1 sodium/proline symporter [Thermococcus kodakarensis]BAD85757.1 sodium/proline symporter, SSF family [Thermococcus kodakarensis KOD1]
MEAQTQMLIVLVGYLLFLISVGIYQGRKTKSSKDFAIAGRQLPGWVAALSERATGESAWALLGLPGFAFAAGLAAIWPAIGCVLGIVVAWVIFAPRLRREAEKYDASTFVDYIAKRHPDAEKWIRILGSLTIAFFFFFYVGAQFIGGGKTLNALFDIDPKIGMIITAMIILPYTVAGGLKSVAYTDTIQAIVMIVTLIIAPIVGIHYISTHHDVFAHSVTEALKASGPEYSTILGGLAGSAAIIFVIAEFSWFFGYLGGMPQLSIRFMAIKDEENAKLARNVGVAWTIIAYIGALLIGWIGIAIFGPSGLADQEQVMPEVMLKLFPPALAAVFITGAVAAMLSTADSLLILASTELSENFLRPFVLAKDMDPRRGLTISRITTIALGIIALIMAFIVPSDLIYTIVGYTWAGIGDTFSVIVILTLFWKKFHGKAVPPTIIAGLLFTVFWVSSGLDAKVSARLMTFIVTAIVAVVATYAIKPENTRTGA